MAPRTNPAALVAAVVAWLLAAPGGSLPAAEQPGPADDQGGDAVVGTRPPEWRLSEWFVPGKPGKDAGHHDDDEGGGKAEGARASEAEADAVWRGGPLAGLRGQVVLVRWWTAPGCPYCRASAPALNHFHERFATKGLQVVGAYHHKSPRPLDPDQVAKWADGFGFRFPVGIDRDWETLDAWWLSRRERAWTSVTFLLDRKGIVRHVHPGGQYVKGDGDYEELESAIRRLLAEPADDDAGS